MQAQNMSTMSFYQACIEGNLDLVKWYVENKLAYPADDYNYAIRKAAQHGRLNVVTFLSKVPGVDPTAFENDAILSSAGKGYLDVVKFLVTLPGVYNNFVVQWAAMNGQLHVIQYLLTIPRFNSTACNIEAIQYASPYGHLDVIIELLYHIPVIPSEVITPELESLIFKRACDLSRFNLPVELCWLIGECLSGPGSGICFGEEKRQTALKKIQWLKIHITAYEYSTHSFKTLWSYILSKILYHK